jgi:TRAP-type mannitol/chloroaromatic compound transport system substrate-binding protein
VLKLNVIAIPILPSGPQAFGWFAKPIKTLDDLKGMKCRETGIAAEIFTRMGMTVVNMPGGEIMPAADRGVIDCAEWVGGVEDLRFGFQNIWKYHYTPGMHEPVTVGELLINGDAWNELDPNLQEIVKSAATETFIRWWARWQKQNADALKELQEKHGVQVLHTPDEILIAFLKTWDGAGRTGSVLQESAGLEARLRQRGRAGEAVHVPGLFLCRRLLLGQDELILEF